MADKPIVILQGGALFMDCIANRWQNSAEIEVKRAGAGSSVSQPSGEETPAVVLFDFDQLGLGSLYVYLANQTGPLVIGLSLSQNAVVLLSGEQKTVATIDDLQTMIMGQLKTNYERRRAGGSGPG